MIETTIQELTAAIRELTVALNNRGSAVPAVAPVPTEPAAPKAKAKPAKVEAAPAAAPAVEELPAAGTNAESIPVAKVTQADLRDAAGKLLAQKRLPDILRINKEHGIRRITECPEDKYEAVFASLNAALSDAPKS